MRLTLTLIVASLVFATPALHAVRVEQDANYSLYDNVLQSYVNAAGLVDYMGLRANSLQDLKTVIDDFAQANLKSMEYPEKLAFWINAYNANLIQLVVNHPEIEKVSDFPALLDTPITVAKNQYTLNDIEHRILRGKTNPKNGLGPIKGVTLEILDSRIHFALNSASLGGPALANFAYTSNNLEQALRKNSIDFVNSPKHVRWEKGRLYISAVMNQYAEDFNQWGGPASYLNRLVDPTLRPDGAELKKHLLTDYTKAEFTSELTLNDIRHAATQRPKLLHAPK